MSAQELGFIFLWALAAAAAIAAPLSLIPALQPKRKHYWERFGYAFANWGVPTWCVVELVQWLVTHRWIPWAP